MIILRDYIAVAWSSVYHSLVQSGMLTHVGLTKTTEISLPWMACTKISLHLKLCDPLVTYGSYMSAFDV